MGRLRKLIGTVLLAAIAAIGVPTVLAGPQESPGVTGTQVDISTTGPQESPGITTTIIVYIAPILIK
jgi:hypothetical protein